MRRWYLAALAGAALLLAALGGVAVASAQDEGQSGQGFSFAQIFLDRLAQRLGIGRDELVQAMRDAANGTVDDALQQGRITQEQAQRLRDRIAQTEPGFPWGWGKGRWGVKAARGVVLQSAAQVLAMSADDLRAELRQGKSLAQVAQEKGMSVDDFKSRLLSQVDQQLSQLVQQGRLTQQQADQLKQRLHNNIDEIVNAQCPRPSSSGSQSGSGQPSTTGVTA
jgi:polyhydroxyalkanoate synthesis regulator phasin